MTHLILNKLKDGLYQWLWNFRNDSYSLPTPEQIGKTNIKIFVITHRDDELPNVFDNRDVYVPLRVGNAINPTIRKDWLVDDVGENISSYNALINEITGIWWVAKHYEEVGNPDYVGFMHYRRFLQWSPELLMKKCFITTSGTSIHRISKLALYVPLEVFRIEMEKWFHKEVLNEYDKYWRSHTFYFSNLFIAEKSVFMLYFNFINNILRMIFDMDRRSVIDLKSKDAYARRVYGFFCEWMLGFFIFLHRDKDILKHFSTMSDFFNIPNLVNSVR